MMLLIKLMSYTKKRHENNINSEKNNKNVSHPRFSLFIAFCINGIKSVFLMFLHLISAMNFIMLGVREFSGKVTMDSPFIAWNPIAVCLNFFPLFLILFLVPFLFNVLGELGES